MNGVISDGMAASRDNLAMLLRLEITNQIEQLAFDHIQPGPQRLMFSLKPVQVGGGLAR